MLWFLTILILTLSIYRLVAYWKKVKNYYKADGIVTGTDRKTVKDELMGDKYFYAAIVEFTDRNGNEQRMIFGEDNPERPLYTNGAKLKLLVHPDDPSKFLEYDFINGYLIPIIWILIGISIVVIPAIFPKAFE